MIRLTCPGCDKKLTVDDSRAGMSGKCPGCRAPIRIPDASEEVTPKPRAKEPSSRVSSPVPDQEAIARTPARRRVPEPVPEVEEPEETEPEEPVEAIVRTPSRRRPSK